MYKISVNGKESFQTEIQHKSGNTLEFTINGAGAKADMVKVEDNLYHMIRDNVSYTIEVVKLDRSEKKLVLKVNNKKYTLDVKDKFDELLHSLGLDNLTAKKVNDVKAPMPGMVLNVLVAEGQEVKKGDALVVLEAMKMENILKSPSDGIVKKIAITKGNSVEKNQLLIQF